MNSNLKIIKVGGKLIENEKEFSMFIKDFKELDSKKILVHGGGNLATEIAGKLGYKTQMLDGRRITDQDSMKVITMVYGGLINKNIVARLNALDLKALGLCGADGGSIISKKRPVGEVDYGFVGDIEEINIDFIDSLLSQDIIPVFSAISCSREGALFNTNADSVASAIAEAMSKKYRTELYYCSEKKGVLEKMEDDNSVIKELNERKYENLVKDGVITDGMLPKLRNCFQALERGVTTIHLGDSTLLRKDALHTKIVK